MANPAGNYPGRQIFLGKTSAGEHAFVYFVSGRSEGSKERCARRYDDSFGIRIVPTVASTPHDPFRHYEALRIDEESGLAVVSNSQAPMDPVFEAYVGNLKFGRDEKLTSGDIVKNMLAAIGPEYDNKEKRTSRVMGLVYPTSDAETHHVRALTVKDGEAHIRDSNPEPGAFHWVTTYDGRVDYKNMQPFDLETQDLLIDLESSGPADLAQEVFELSDYSDPEHGELRVLTIAGVMNGGGPGGWEVWTRDRHTDEPEKLLW